MASISFVSSSALHNIQSTEIVHVYIIEKLENNPSTVLAELNKSLSEPFDPSLAESSKTFIFENKLSVIMGAGEAPFIESKLIELGGGIFKKLQCMKQHTAIVHKSKNVKPEQLAFGAMLRSIKFEKYKSKKSKPEITIRFETDDENASETLFKEFISEYEAIKMVRNLVNEPANELYPASYATFVLNELKDIGLKINVFDEQYIKQKSMNAMYGVAQGSVNQPRLVTIEWHGADDKNAPFMAFIGKGVTFDTGGVSLKPAKGMWDMKSDMAGSAALVGLMKVLAERKSKTNVVALLGLVENSIGCRAQRPGDIVTSMSGKTIEVLNTDAEGRLVLADVITYAQKMFSPSIVIDIATLTGAIVVALGDKNAGLFSNNDALAEKLTQAGAKSGEQVWRFPMSKEYDKLVDSHIADMKNISTSGRGADSISAAQFLLRFVEEGVLWAHLDIAGVAYIDSETSINDIGATGFGVRLLSEFVKMHE